ncbi:coiled-coil domain-containing protein 120 isoform X1 [Tenrec ecaudatus]|uniref:coiled-coil domain-containing protein 120 isoform X1 n=1 Tax=Tenrec ecaudatus TaxID=94439 RepID=UPI003F5A1783
MEVKAALFGEAAPQVKSERLRGLLDRQRVLQETLNLKLQELRKVCLQEAELTGQLPPECPLEPGERPQLVRRRPPAARTYPPSHPNPARHALCSAEELALEALEREVSVQQQIAAAARRLALAPELSGEQRRRRRQVQADALRRLHELEEQLRDVRACLGLPVLPPPQPLPLSTGTVITTQGLCLGTRLTQLSQEDVVLHSESSSLSESGASHDNEEPHGSCFPLAERPSPPKAWDQLRAVSGGSPERRAPWKPPPPDLYGDLKSRRNSVASPTSPTRSLPRSASSFEGRSVPATPVLSRGAGPQLCKPEGLHSRQWSGSQDSQMGFPRADPASDHVSDHASLFAARTRRSNSSEALLVDRAAGGGASSPPAPPHPPAAGPPVCKSSEVLYEHPQPVPAFSSRTAGPPDPPRAARPSSAAPASRGVPRHPPVCDFLLDYSLERGLPRGSGGPGWGELLPAVEVPGALSRREGPLAMLPGSPPVYAADGSSPLLRSKDPQARATRTKPCGLPLDASEGLEGHPAPLLWMPPPTRNPLAGERSGHKNLALEGLRDWYIRNSGLAAGPQRRPAIPHMGSSHQPFLHARCYEVGQVLYGTPSQAPLPHSRSFTAPPVSSRYGGCFY